jgi:isoleucyl-tRNA synthetase
MDESAPESVHLNPFPDADGSAIDEALSSDMSAVLAVVRLGRAARSEANVKVRQPLPALLVHTSEPSGAEAVVRLKDQILDELNVKDVEALSDVGGYVTPEIKPNLPVLGPKYGKRLGAIRSAIQQADARDLAAKIGAGESVVLPLADDSEVTLEPSELLLTLRKREGFAAAQDDQATVVLETMLTPELLQEGLARDFVRAIQDARKQAEFRIEETIAVRVQTDDDLRAAIEANRDYVMREVLATSLDFGPIDGSVLGETTVLVPDLKVGDHRATATLRPSHSG